MANPQGGSSGKKREKFDEATFFRHLRNSAGPGLLDLMRSIDGRACIEICTYAIRYLRRSEETDALAARRQRGAKITKALLAAINTIKKASAAYRKLAAIEHPMIGPLGKPGTRLVPLGTPFFPDVLDKEETKLIVLLKDQRRLFNEKRFGVSGNHMWLVMLQEFTSAWTTRELGKARRLKTEEIADMVTAAKVTLGWREDKSETDPELLGKAIRHFRKVNASFVSQQIVPYVRMRCDSVAESPFLLGIEI